MSATDETLFETMVRVENKDIFVDLKKNKGGVYLKISERNGAGRNTVLIPSSGIAKLKAVLDDVVKVSSKSKIVSKERKTRSVVDPTVVSRSVYVSGLSWDTTDEELYQHFNQIGPVTKAVIMRQRRGNSKTSMGCGVVEYANDESAVLAVSRLNETTFKGRIIHCREDRDPDFEDDDSVGRANAGAGVGVGGPGGYPPSMRAPYNNGGGMGGGLPRSPTSSAVPSGVAGAGVDRKAVDSTKIFVSGLDWAVTDDDLRQHFNNVGTIVSAQVMMNRKGRSMGSGTVEFTDTAAVTAAVTTLNQSEIKGRKIGVRQYYQ